MHLEGGREGEREGDVGEGGVGFPCQSKISSFPFAFLADCWISGLHKLGVICTVNDSWTHLISNIIWLLNFDQSCV